MSDQDHWRISQGWHTHDKGGQHHNGPEHRAIRVEHMPTGIRLIVPSGLARSQHRARMAAIDGLTMALLTLGEKP